MSHGEIHDPTAPSPLFNEALMYSLGKIPDLRYRIPTVNLAFIYQGAAMLLCCLLLFACVMGGRVFNAPEGLVNTLFLSAVLALLLSLLPRTRPSP